MAETNQRGPLLIPEPKGEGFEAGEQRDGRHGLKQRIRRRGFPTSPESLGGQSRGRKCSHRVRALVAPKSRPPLFVKPQELVQQISDGRRIGSRRVEQIPADGPDGDTGQSQFVNVRLGIPDGAGHR
jgi:hypothetical protein